MTPYLSHLLTNAKESGLQNVSLSHMQNLGTAC